jgi:putative cardiolipin synthase
MERWRDYVREESEGGATGIYARAVNSTLMADIRDGHVKPVTAPAMLITDSPDKLLADVGEKGVAELAIEIGRRFGEAKREIIIVTPYFIPQDAGAATLEAILRRGVRLIIVTNSLASTNHVPVHSAYTRYRKRLLQAGAEIYEIRAHGTAGKSEWGHQPERVTLHSKATVIDQQTVFIGSLNFDPRSILINTEMGLFVESDDIGSRFAELLREDLANVTYQVILNDQDQLRWVYRRGDVEERTSKEPQSSWWRRVQARLYRLLPEGQL